MNNNTDLFEMVTIMKNVWESFRCNEKLANLNGFHFGWAPEVNDIHEKNRPLMIVNPPSSNAVIDDFERNVVNTTTQWRLQIYDFYPSENFNKNNIHYAESWDKLEDCFYYWLQTVLNDLGAKCVLGNGSLGIVRTKDASNDQMYMLDITFNTNTFRYCMALVQNPPVV